MTCRHCVDAAELFGDSMARRELKRFRKRGPTRSTRLLLEGIREALQTGGPNGATGSPDASAGDGGPETGPMPVHLLDIGGGVGALQHELLAEGGRTATAVDASPAYLAAARREARRRGTAERVEYRSGDAVELAPELPTARVVTLDRVLCCYPDMPALVEVSAQRALECWAVVVPRESWWVRVGVAGVNLFEWARRKAFRVFVHALEDITAEAARHGLQPVFRRRTLLWEVRIYVRTEVPGG